MKKFLAMLCATMLCVCCLGLAACGGGSSSSAASSGSASASSSAADPAAQFAGTWQLAAIQSQGITMSGDLSAMLDSSEGMVLTINADGTGSMNFAGQTGNITWVAKDASTITLTPVTESSDSAASASASAESASASAASASAEASSASASAESASASAASASAESASAAAADVQTIDVTYKDGALFMTMATPDFNGEAIFTADGKYAAANEIDMTKATAITSQDALVGEWTLCGMNMMGISMYGEAADLAALAGDTDISLSIAQDGTVKIMGSDAKVAMGSDGAAIDFSGVQIPVKALDDKIAIDMSAALGMDMIMVFGK